MVADAVKGTTAKAKAKSTGKGKGTFDDFLEEEDTAGNDWGENSNADEEGD